MQIHRRNLIKAATGVLLAASFMAPVAHAADIKIGFLLKTMEEERYQRDKAAFIKKAEVNRPGTAGGPNS